jgi:hypothetical protein
METLTIKEFAQANNIKEYALKVRANSNGYLFVTFMNFDNEATNVYFSQAMTEKIAEGDSVGQVIKEHGCKIATVTNAAGEERIKLVGNGENQRGSIEDLF